MKPQTAVEAFLEPSDFISAVEAVASKFLRQHAVASELKELSFTLKGVVRLRRKLSNVLIAISKNNIRTLDDIFYVSVVDSVAIFTMVNKNIRTDRIDRFVLTCIKRSEMFKSRSQLDIRQGTEVNIPMTFPNLRVKTLPGESKEFVCAFCGEPN